MKKCNKCGRDFGEDAHSRHILLCGAVKLVSRGIASSAGIPHEHEKHSVSLVKSDEFMKWLSEEYVEDHEQIGVIAPSIISKNQEQESVPFESKVNPSPRILFKTAQANKSAPKLETIAPRRRPNSSGAWRTRTEMRRNT